MECRSIDAAGLVARCAWIWALRGFGHLTLDGNQVRTYEQTRGHGPDFIVKYCLFSPVQGGRTVTFQHLRCDFMYEGDDPQTGGIYMIHPEFLDPSGVPLADDEPVPLEGTASMWVLTPQMRTAHQARVKVGVRGFFMEGPRKVGAVEVVRIEALHANPTA